LEVIAAGRLFPIVETMNASVPRGDAADVNGAVEAAARAFPAWSKTALRDRGRLLLRIADAMEERSEELARTIALETGNIAAIEAVHGMTDAVAGREVRHGGTPDIVAGKM
jgi:acyl-CoA reductase-like NAD-dependent aldehyde dehydrogenase